MAFRRFGRHGNPVYGDIRDFMRRHRVETLIGAGVLVAVILLVMLISHTAERQKYNESFMVTSDTIKIGIRTDFAGFAQLGEDGQITGYEKDVIDLVLSELIDEPKIYEYVPLTSQDAGAALKYGDAQICLGHLSPGRVQTTGFSLTAPYYTDRVVAVVPDSSPIQDVSSFETGIGVLATALSVDEAQAALLKMGVDVPLTSYSDYESALTDLSHSRINAVLMPFTAARQYLDSGFKIIAQPIYEVSYGIMLSASDTAVAQEINRVLKKLNEDGRLAALRTRWSI